MFEQKKRFVNVFLLKLLFPTEFSSWKVFCHYSIVYVVDKSIPFCVCTSPLPPSLPPLSLSCHRCTRAVWVLPPPCPSLPHYLLSSHTLSLAAFSLSQEQFVSKVCPGDILHCYCLVTHSLFHPLLVLGAILRITLNLYLFMRIIVAHNYD